MAPTEPKKLIDKYVRERETIKGKISWLEGKLAEHTTTAIPKQKAERYMETVTTTQKKLEDNYQFLSEIPELENLQEHTNEYTQCMDKIFELEYQFSLIIVSYAVPEAPHSSNGSTISNNGNHMRLPRLTLPYFDGKIEEWTSFRDMFNSSIENDNSLSNSQKLTYLKGQLKGEALRQIQSLAITDTNYAIAWSLLSERYQNDRQILFALVKRLLQYHEIKNPSAHTIRQLVDTSKECIRSLEVLNQPVHEWDSIIVVILHQKLDPHTKELYEQTLKDSSVPKLQGLFDFMEQRARALEVSTTIFPAKSSKHYAIQKQSMHAVHRERHCKLCNEQDHPLFKCQKFLSLSVSDRFDACKKVSCCFNCLRVGHAVSQCSSKKLCIKCNAKHHSLLHKDTENLDAKTGSNQESTLQISHHTRNANVFTQTLLGTALVRVKHANNQCFFIRAFLDSGSETHIITTQCAKRLGLVVRRQRGFITGLSMTPVGRFHGTVDVEMHPHFTDEPLFVARNARVMDSITGKLPLYQCRQNFTHLSNLQLADKNWFKPGDIDILIGSSLAYELVQGGRKYGNHEEPFAVQSSLGWIIVGDICSSNVSKDASLNMHLSKPAPSFSVLEAQNDDLHSWIKKFWELEHVKSKSSWSPSETACENVFASTTTRDANGRFVVRLPFKHNPPQLGKSLSVALKRLHSMEHKLEQCETAKEEYKKFMEEYILLGHMEKLSQTEIMNTAAYYIPHHYIEKSSSTTTAFRVVFDASAISSNGNSLNDNLLVGPVIQDALLDILMRFRTHKFVFCADIAKMFRQIWLAPEDADYQRIVWRESSNHPIQHYRLLTVTYGTSSAPFLAQRCLKELGLECMNEYPEASKVISNDFYMDDLMSGCDNEANAIKLKNDLIRITNSCGFQLRKWCSNSSVFLETIPENLRETNSLLPIDFGQTIKTLGVCWNRDTDEFLFTEFAKEIKSTNCATKRAILSDIAKLFDPVGWVSPLVLRAKLIMQKLWKLNLAWDEVVPMHLEKEWRGYCNALKNLDMIRIPRCVKPIMPAILALIGFCDASENGYGACVYFCCYSGESDTRVNLLTSKTKVAPLKPVTLPRLELCAAHLLANLIDVVLNALRISFDHISAWTDSQIALAWIRSQPSRWKKFVANRVADIQAVIPPSSWGHVSGAENPADLASRGADPVELSQNTLWWNGPAWLRDGIPMVQSVIPTDNSQEMMIEAIPVASYHGQTNQLLETMSTFSSFFRLIRVMSWVLRFLNNCRIKANRTCDTASEAEDAPGVGLHTSWKRGLGAGSFWTPSCSKQTGPLLASELQETTRMLVKLEQFHYFNKEITKLSRGEAVPFDSTILSLNPFLHTDGTLRVGGRLRFAQSSFDRRFPMILSKHGHLKTILIQTEHVRLLHAGPQQTLASLQQRYWIPGARNSIRNILRRCVRCTKQQGRQMHQIMADLPAFRVNSRRPFQMTGVDFAGPLHLEVKLPTNLMFAFLCVVLPEQYT